MRHLPAVRARMSRVAGVSTIYYAPALLPPGRDPGSVLARCPAVGVVVAPTCVCWALSSASMAGAIWCQRGSAPQASRTGGVGHVTVGARAGPERDSGGPERRSEQVTATTPRSVRAC